MRRATVALIAALAVPAAPALARTTDLGTSGWQVQSSAQVPQSPTQVSSPGFAPSGWLAVHNTGGAPGTEIGAELQNGKCPHVFYGTNMRTCFGYLSGVGAETIPRFAVPWWFRTTFPHPTHGDNADLIIDGVVGEADVFLNGREIADHEQIQGDDTRFVLPVTRLLRPGLNAIAFRVYPNDPLTMFTLDNVDWTQVPPDNNTGIQFPVQLDVSRALSLTNTHVVQQDSADLSQAALTVKGTVTNNAPGLVRGVVSTSVTSPTGAVIHLSEPVSLAAGATRTVSFSPARFSALTLTDPAVWWPYQMGAQPLYGLSMSVTGPTGAVSDSQSETFGIRTITTRLVGPGPLTPQGSRQFLVNGVPITFRGGGWSEDLFLRYRPRDIANQIELIKNLGLNGIRTEGKQMPENFYEQMDRAGILIDAGYQCCDAWQLQMSHLTTPHDYALLANSAYAIGQNLRNHPSVLNFSWSDNKPTPEQARVSIAAFRRADFQDPLITSAEYKTDARLGTSGEKEGPYNWVPPSYWYSTEYDPSDPTRTNVGGAWGFDSEASAGDTVPTLSALKSFMTPTELRELWQDPNHHQYHLNYEHGKPGPANGGYVFGSLSELDRAIAARYGHWHSLAQYVEEAQVQNYETQRAQFEAYIANSQNAVSPSTGVDYWMLNKGWPTLLWTLYNNDYDEPGSFFGAQEANRNLHVFYRYDNGQVGVDDVTGAAASGLTVTASVYGLQGKLLSSQTSGPVSVAAESVDNGVLTPTVPAQTSPPTPAHTYWVALTLSQDGQVVDRNTYWMSTQPDEVNWPATIGQPQATMTRYANLTALQSLRPAQVAVTVSSHPQAGDDGTDEVADVTITNTSHTTVPAFFLRTDLRRGSATGVPAPGDDVVRPVFWNENDTTLFPGESETSQVAYATSQLRGASPVISVSGWNVKPQDLVVP